jgi:hypothetical protein
MSDTTIAIRTDEDRNWLLEQIEREKIERLGQRSSRDRRLTVHDADLWLSRPLLKPELIALIQGMVPAEDGDTSFLDPKDCPVVQRLLADEAAGIVRYPMLPDETSNWLRPWYAELCDALQGALDRRTNGSGLDGETGDLPANAPSQADRERKNSRAYAVLEVKRCMEVAIGLLRAAGMNAQPESLPGTRAPYHEYLRKHSDRLRDLGDETLDDYRSECGYACKKTGGKNRETMDSEHRRILGLTCKDENTVVSGGKTGPPEVSWLTALPR